MVIDQQDTHKSREQRNGGRRRRLLALLLAGSLSVAACGDDGGGDGDAAGSSSGSGTTGAASPTADVCTDDKPVRDLVVSTSGDRKGFDPAQVTGAGLLTGGMEMTAIFDTLMRWDPESGSFKPHVAESLESTDGKVWTLKLRPDVKFGNGDPLDASAVVASLERLRKSQVSAAGTMALISAMDIVDPLTLRFTLTGTWGEFPYFLASPGGMIVNAKVADQKGAAAFTLDPTGAGVGPFEITRFSPGEEIVMTAKKNYWGGHLCIGTLRIVQIDDDRAAYESLKLGEISVRGFDAADVLYDLRQDSYFGLSTGGQNSQIQFNLRATSPLKDIRVRQAVAHALDVNLINERQTLGRGLATTSIVDPRSPLYTAGASGLPYDQAKARALVTEAKAAGWDGKLDLICPNTSQEVSISVKAQLEAVGIAVNATNVQTTDMVTKVAALEYQASCWSLNVLNESAWVGIDRNLRSDSRSNRSGLSDPGMDAALIKLRDALTPEEKKAGLFGVQQEWNRTVPGVVFARQEEFVTWNKNVRGVQVTREGVFMLHDAWLAS